MLIISKTIFPPMNLACDPSWDRFAYVQYKEGVFIATNRRILCHVPHQIDQMPAEFYVYGPHFAHLVGRSEAFSCYRREGNYILRYDEYKGHPVAFAPFVEAIPEPGFPVWKKIQPDGDRQFLCEISINPTLMRDAETVISAHRDELIVMNFYGKNKAILLSTEDPDRWALLMPKLINR